MYYWKLNHSTYVFYNKVIYFNMYRSRETIMLDSGRQSVIFVTYHLSEFIDGYCWIIIYLLVLPLVPIEF